jgi:hypothetical protein
MISSVKKTIYCFCILLMLALICEGFSNSSDTKVIQINKNEINEPERSKELQKLQLNIAVVLSNEMKLPRLAFVAKNNNNKDLIVPEFCRGKNRIEIIKPNGEKTGDYVFWDGIIGEVVIKPSESKIWYMDTMLYNTIFLDEGIYRIKWKINDAESQEFLLLKEKEKKEENQPSKIP